jgi:hypothetical protein
MKAAVCPQFVKVPVTLNINAPFANVPLPPLMSYTEGVPQLGFATGAHENDEIVNDELLVTEAGTSAHGTGRTSVLSVEDVIVKGTANTEVQGKPGQTVSVGHSPTGPN